MVLTTRIKILVVIALVFALVPVAGQEDGGLLDEYVICIGDGLLAYLGIEEPAECIELETLFEMSDSFNLPEEPGATMPGETVDPVTWYEEIFGAGVHHNAFAGFGG